MYPLHIYHEGMGLLLLRGGGLVEAIQAVREFERAPDLGVVTMQLAQHVEHLQTQAQMLLLQLGRARFLGLLQQLDPLGHLADSRLQVQDSDLSLSHRRIECGVALEEIANLLVETGAFRFIRPNLSPGEERSGLFRNRRSLREQLPQPRSGLMRLPVLGKDTIDHGRSLSPGFHKSILLVVQVHEVLSVILILRRLKVLHALLGLTPQRLVRLLRKNAVQEVADHHHCREDDRDPGLGDLLHPIQANRDGEKHHRDADKQRDRLANDEATQLLRSALLGKGELHRPV
jgi:hypothetical protein